MLFNGWSPLGRALFIGLIAYVFLVLLLRIGGKRTLANMDEFDLVVLVAMGNLFATAMLSPDVSLSQTVMALALLVILQVAVTWAMSRYPRISRLIESEPRLLVFRGQILREATKKARLSEDELFQAIRRKGIGAVEDVEALVMETNGDFSVIRKGERSLSALRSVPTPRQ
jgi:uncharacterized membrane protein YcaP (DUF421 family)